MKLFKKFFLSLVLCLFVTANAFGWGYLYSEKGIAFPPEAIEKHVADIWEDPSGFVIFYDRDNDGILDLNIEIWIKDRVRGLVFVGAYDVTKMNPGFKNAAELIEYLKAEQKKIDADKGEAL